MRIVRTGSMVFLACLATVAAVRAGEAKTEAPAGKTETVAETPSRLLPVVRFGKHGLIDTQGTIRLEPEYEEVHETTSEGLRGILKGKRWGFVDATCAMAIKPAFDSVRPFAGGMAAVETKDAWGYIDTRGAFVIEPTFAKAYSFAGDWARAAMPAEAEGKGMQGVRHFRFGFIDRKGAWALETEFAFVEDFAEDRALVNKGGKWAWGKRLFGGTWGFIDRAGKLVVDAVYEKAHPFTEGLAAVRKDGLWGYVDAKGAEVIAPAFVKAGDFRDGLAIVRAKGKKTGVIDKTGAFVVPPEYDAVLPFADGTAVVRKDLAYGVVDRSGKVLRTPDAVEMGDWSEGLVAVRLEPGGYWGYMDRQGKLVVEPEYTWAGAFSEGLAHVNKGGTIRRGSSVVQYRSGKWGYIDKTGTLVLPMEFTGATAFVDGCAVVLGQESWHQWNGIDRKGEATTKPFGARYPEMLPGGIVKLIGYHRDSLGYYNLELGKLIWELQK